MFTLSKLVLMIFKFKNILLNFYNKIVRFFINNFVRFNSELSLNQTFNGNPFHLVDPSPWPFLSGLAAFSTLTSAVAYMQNINPDTLILKLSFIYLLFCMYRWFSDIIVEATFEGQHTKAVLQGLRYGMLLFIVSEVMFFFSFFWSFFHYSVAPSVALGCVWPPIGIQTLDPWMVPFLNTVILLSSGVTITWAHKALIGGFREEVTNGMAATIFLGIIFTGFQAFEYKTSTFSINDSVYGSIFYMATGFHGFHVLVGTLFIFFSLLRHIKYHFTVEQHFGFEAAAWYWHFVDVVWLFLFAAIYWWGS